MRVLFSSTECEIKIYPARLTEKREIGIRDVKCLVLAKQLSSFFPFEQFDLNIVSSVQVILVSLYILIPHYSFFVVVVAFILPQSILNPLWPREDGGISEFYLHFLTVQLTVFTDNSFHFMH